MFNKKWNKNKAISNHFTFPVALSVITLGIKSYRSKHSTMQQMTQCVAQENYLKLFYAYRDVKLWLDVIKLIMIDLPFDRNNHFIIVKEWFLTTYIYIIFSSCSIIYQNIDTFLCFSFLFYENPDCTQTIRHFNLLDFTIQNLFVSLLHTKTPQHRMIYF